MKKINHYLHTLLVSVFIIPSISANNPAELICSSKFIQDLDCDGQVIDIVDLVNIQDSCCALPLESLIFKNEQGNNLDPTNEFFDSGVHAINVSGEDACGNLIECDLNLVVGDSIITRCNKVIISTEADGTITLPVDAFGTILPVCNGDFYIPITSIGFDPEFTIDTMTWGCSDPYSDSLNINLFFNIYFETMFGLDSCEAITLLINPIESIQCNPFVTTWETKVPFDTISIPVNDSDYTYNYIIDWGDGTSSNYNSSAKKVYAQPGEYQITINGKFPQIYFNDDPSSMNILSIDQWGDQPWKSFENAFSGCSNLVINAIDNPVLDSLNGTFVSAFKECSNLNYDFSNWDFSEAKLMDSMLMNCSSFDQNLADWNIQDVNSMKDMLTGTNISTVNYDSLLFRWSQLELQDNVELGATNLNYCQAEDERTFIINQFGWIIDDDGLSEDCFVNTDEMDITSLVYPNPTEEYLFFPPSFRKYEFRILNTKQKLILSGQIQDRVNIGKIESGLYFLQLLDQSSLVETLRIVKI